jgi:hypothetical protein
MFFNILESVTRRVIVPPLMMGDLGFRIIRAAVTQHGTPITIMRDWKEFWFHQDIVP